MTLKEIVNQTVFEDVINELVSVYPECLVNQKELEEVYYFIKSTPKCKFDDFEIHIYLVDSSSDSEYEEGIDEDAYIMISGYSSKEDIDFALGFARWEEWSNAEILIGEEIHMSNEALTAVCLYEMTFYGYDQDVIAKELKVIEVGITDEIFH